MRSGLFIRYTKSSTGYILSTSFCAFESILLMNYCIVDEYVKMSLNYGVHLGSPLCNTNALSEHLHEHDCTSCYTGCSLFHFNVLLLSFISRQLLKVHMVKTSAATFIKPLLSSPSTNSLLLLAAIAKRFHET